MSITLNAIEMVYNTTLPQLCPKVMPLAPTMPQLCLSFCLDYVPTMYNYHNGSKAETMLQIDQFKMTFLQHHFLTTR